MSNGSSMAKEKKTSTSAHQRCMYVPWNFQPYDCSGFPWIISGDLTCENFNRQEWQFLIILFWNSTEKIKTSNNEAYNNFFAHKKADKSRGLALYEGEFITRWNLILFESGRKNILDLLEVVKLIYDSESSLLKTWYFWSTYVEG